MTPKRLPILSRECDALMAQAHALLSDARYRFDPGMAAFVRTYLPAIEQDFKEATRSRADGWEAQLALIAAELLDLVVDLRCRRELDDLHIHFPIPYRGSI